MCSCCSLVGTAVLHDGLPMGRGRSPESAATPASSLVLPSRGSAVVSHFIYVYSRHGQCILPSPFTPLISLSHRMLLLSPSTMDHNNLSASVSGNCHNRLHIHGNDGSPRLLRRVCHGLQPHLRAHVMVALRQVYIRGGRRRQCGHLRLSPIAP